MKLYLYQYTGLMTVLVTILVSDDAVPVGILLSDDAVTVPIHRSL
jgi:hypothetical protein